MGIRSLANVLTDYDTDATALRFGGNSVKIKEDMIIITMGENTFVIESDKITGTLSAGVSIEIDSAGKFKVTNNTGEFVTALITFLQTATAGGFPLVGDLSTLLTFKA